MKPVLITAVLSGCVMHAMAAAQPTLKPTIEYEYLFGYESYETTTLSPTKKTASVPTLKPKADGTPKPTTKKPSTTVPSGKPIESMTLQPTSMPVAGTLKPTSAPIDPLASPKPTREKTPFPTKKPRDETPFPTKKNATPKPTKEETASPTRKNSSKPTAEATPFPTKKNGTPKPTKDETPSPTKKNSPKPTAGPGLAPSAPSGSRLESWEVCTATGGYIADGMEVPCAPSWTYRAAASDKLFKFTGCVSTSDKYSPFIDPNNPPLPPKGEGWTTTAWCSISPNYRKDKASLEWGYCKCDDFGCTAARNNQMTNDFIGIAKSLPPAVVEWFVALAKANDHNPIPLLSVEYNVTEASCSTDGGYDSGVKCAETWTYISDKGVSTEIDGCASTANTPPYRGGGIVLPKYESTDRKFWCSTVPTYSVQPKSKTIKNWGYCRCVTEATKASVNMLISLYNPLKAQDRDEVLKTLH